MVPAKSWEYIKAQPLMSPPMSSPGEPPVVTGVQPLCTRLRGWTFSLFLFLSSIFGAMYIITPLLPFLFWNPPLWRKIMDRLIGFWVIMPGALMTYLFGASINIRGDLIEYGEPGIIIMNHRTRLDWLFFWNALYKMDPWLCTSEKITLKGILKYVPGAGWAMGCNSFIFLDRSFDTDKTKIDRMLDYYAKVGLNYQLLLFPEGTDKCPKATERSRIHAEKKSLVHYDYVLHPRTTGFVHIVQNMRKANNIKFIYDVTVGFGESIVQSEVDLVANGLCPTNVQYQVRKIDIDALPMDNAGLSEWLIELWKEKEENLRQFYAKSGEERLFDQTPGGKDYEMSETNFFVQLFIIFIWVLVTFFWISACFQSSLMFYFAVFSCVVFCVIQRVYGGIEWLAVEKFNQSRAVLGAEPVPLTPDGKLPLVPSDSDSE